MTAQNGHGKRLAGKVAIITEATANLFLKEDAGVMIVVIYTAKNEFGFRKGGEKK